MPTRYVRTQEYRRQRMRELRNDRRSTRSDAGVQVPHNNSSEQVREDIAQPLQQTLEEGNNESNADELQQKGNENISCTGSHESHFAPTAAQTLGPILMCSSSV